MTKKDFINLADAIRYYNEKISSQGEAFTLAQLDCLADYCNFQNPAFKRERWLSYIHGECGLNGGRVKGAES